MDYYNDQSPTLTGLTKQEMKELKDDPEFKPLDEDGMPLVTNSNINTRNSKKEVTKEEQYEVNLLHLFRINQLSQTGYSQHSQLC